MGHYGFPSSEKRSFECAELVEEEVSRVKNTQAQDLMRALALLYREMAEELENSGLFERRLFPLCFPWTLSISPMAIDK